MNTLLLRSFSIYFLVILINSSAWAQDKNLEYFISAGIKNSPLLNDYRNQSQAAIIDSLRIKAEYNPQVTASSVNSYAPTIKDWGYDKAITNGTNFSQQVIASKQIVSNGNLKNQYQSIQLLNKSLEISGKISEQDLKKSITAQYITAYGDWQQYSFNKEVYNLMGKEEIILKKLTQSGVYRQTDYLTFLVTVQQQKLLISQIHLQFQNEFATLNYLCGLTDTSTVALIAPVLDTTAAVSAVENTVFYEQFKVDSLKLRNSDTQIDFAYKPRLNVYSDVGYVSTFAQTPYKNFGASVGLNITVPIYDGRQRKMQHDKITIAEKTRQGYQHFFKNQYYQQIAALTQQLKSTQLLIAQSTDQLKYVMALIQANRQLIQTGEVRMTDYILAIGNYLSVQNAIRQNKINKLQLINQINYWNRK